MIVYYQKHKRENESIDMSTLPPCSSTLEPHSTTRPTFDSGIWKRSDMQRITWLVF